MDLNYQKANVLHAWFVISDKPEDFTGTQKDWDDHCQYVDSLCYERKQCNE